MWIRMKEQRIKIDDHLNWFILYEDKMTGESKKNLHNSWYICTIAYHTANWEYNFHVIYLN